MVGPIVSQTFSDVFCDNEYGPNFLFRNNGDGTFTDVAQQAGNRNIYSLTDHSFVDQFILDISCESCVTTIHIGGFIVYLNVLKCHFRSGGPHAAWQRCGSRRLQP